MPPDVSSAPSNPTSREFFEQLYRADPDPWRFAQDAYERDRYDHLLALVPPGRYDTAFEPGCSIGVLTRQLADRCRRVIAIDIAETAVAEARRRCADRPGAELARGELPHDMPDERLDLVVLSEIGYYFTEPVLGELAHRIRDVINPGGSVVAVHWTGQSTDHVLHGSAVHRVLGAQLGLAHRLGAEHRRAHVPGRTPTRSGPGVVKGYLLDVWDAAI